MKTKDETLRMYAKSQYQTMVVFFSVATLSIAITNLVLLSARFNWANTFTVFAMLPFSALCFRIAYVQSVPGRLYLELNSQEFVERSPLATFRRSWQDVESFAVGFDDGSRVVAYRLIGSCRRWYHAWLKPGGGDGRLIQIYDLDTEALADLLESWRLRYGKKTAAFHDLIDDSL
jgi:hypothetical protein